jgi:Glycosyl hydrolase family 26/Bacterial Ig-like domain (group 3)
MFRLTRWSRVSRAALVFSITTAAMLTAVGLPVAREGVAAAGNANPLGVYVGYQAPGKVSSFGRMIGAQPAFAMDFLDGDSWSALVNTAPSYMAAWKGSGDTMIWGIPMLPNAGSGGGYTLAQGASGAYNSYFVKLAQDMVAGGQGSSIIRPGWEFNGGWYTWAAKGQAAAYIGYWQQIVNTMRSVSGQNFTFEWNPTAGDQGIGDLANYYPGNAYVDYIGLDVYDEAWGLYAGIASQWNTDLTEPYGLNWLASFAASEGKPITLPEWGLGWGPPNNGGVLSDAGNSVGGGDDPTFINDMAQWISEHNVYEATFWQYDTSLLGQKTNPNSLAAFEADFGAGSSGSSGAETTTTTSPSTTTTTTTTTTTPASGSSSGTSSSGTGGAPSSGSVGSWTPSPPNTLPDGSQSDPGVSNQSPTTPVPTWRGDAPAHISMVGSRTGGQPSRAMRCHSGSHVVRRKNGMTRCKVGPYRVSAAHPDRSDVAASSVSLTDPAAKASSHIRTAAVVPSGGSAVITAAVLGLPVAAGTVTGTVTFAIAGASGQTLSCVAGDSVPLVSGVATCTTTVAEAAGSTYVVTATYSGDSTFQGSTSFPRKIKVR